MAQNDRKFTPVVSVHDARSKAQAMLDAERAKPRHARMYLFEAELELCIRLGMEYK